VRKQCKDITVPLCLLHVVNLNHFPFLSFYICPSIFVIYIEHENHFISLALIRCHVSRCRFLVIREIFRQMRRRIIPIIILLMVPAHISLSCLIQLSSVWGITRRLHFMPYTSLNKLYGKRLSPIHTSRRFILHCR
jgi:hypothetical protein